MPIFFGLPSTDIYLFRQHIYFILCFFFFYSTNFFSVSNRPKRDSRCVPHLLSPSVLFKKVHDTQGLAPFTSEEWKKTAVFRGQAPLVYGFSIPDPLLVPSLTPAGYRSRSCGALGHHPFTSSSLRSNKVDRVRVRCRFHFCEHRFCSVFVFFTVVGLVSFERICAPIVRTTVHDVRSHVHGCHVDRGQGQRRYRGTLTLLSLCVLGLIRKRDLTGGNRRSGPTG